MKNRLGIILLIFFISIEQIAAQDSEKVEAYSTFGSNRIGLTQSAETYQKGILTFDIQHQFGALNTGISELFGLDQATTRLGFGYGITDWLSLGIGRTALFKTYNGSMKIKILHQKTGSGIPLTLTYYGNISAYTTEWNRDDIAYFVSHRFSYVNQLLIAKKFNDKLSVQISPTHIHRNFVLSKEEDNDVFDVGFAARYLIADKFGLSVDYHYVLSEHTAQNYNNSLSIGLNILTAGHVFHLFVSNSSAMLTDQFVPTTQGNWLDGDIHFGFTIARKFTIIQPDYF